MMKKVSNGVAVVEKFIGSILMLSMAILVTVAVGFRYFLHSPLSWAGEVSIFLLIWISFIGGSLGLKYKTQASVTFLLDYVSDKVKKILLIVGHVCMLLFLITILYYSYQWIFSSNVAAQRSSAILLPMWIPFSAVPIGLTFASIHLIANLVEIIRGEEAK